MARESASRSWRWGVGGVGVGGATLMARRRYGQTEARIAKWDAEGRGHGHGGSYRPWLTVRDVPSLGRVHRVPSRFGRVVHLMSDVEYSVFLEFEDDPAVVDVREQFPLPRAETVVIAEQLGVRHPADHGTLIVMTTDLLVDWRGGTSLPVAVKISTDLAKPRVLEKLDIEREYWRRRGLDWGLVTEKETSLDRRVHLASLAGWRDDGHLPDADLWRSRAGALLVSFVDAFPCRLTDFLRSVERERGWPAGDAIAGLRFLLANRGLRLVAGDGIDFDGSLDQFSLATSQA